MQNEKLKIMQFLIYISGSMEQQIFQQAYSYGLYIIGVVGKAFDTKLYDIALKI